MEHVDDQVAAGVATGPCLNDQLAHSLAMGTLDAAASAAARAHIDSCDSCRDLVATVAATGDAPPPEMIGRYQITTMLGSGAMGIVYEAIDPQLERRVAIKVLRGEGHRDRLLREARAAAQISHPNVIAVFDAGIADGEVFMAMELIRGRTLRQWLGETERSWREIVAVAVKAGRGLAAIHRAGLVHRDVKPENVLVADDGRIIVTDLGLVRVEPGAAPPRTLQITQTGAVVGTPAYAAPEQLDRPAAIDARADQFSYCVTVYEALVGRRPFEGATLGELRDAIDRGAAPLTGDVPASIDDAIRRGLAATPDARWPDIDALVDELERVLAPKRRAVWIAAGAAGAAAIAAVALLASSRTSDGPQCQLGHSELARVWNPAVRTSIGLGFARANVSYAASTWRAAAQAIDAYSDRLADAYDAACAATQLKHTQSAAILELRAQCLDRRRIELAALLDVFANADASQIDRAATAASSLTSPDVCADVELLRATEPVPDDPAKRKQVTELRAGVARVQALSKSGKYKEALELAKQTSTQATQLGYAPLVAEIDSQRGRIAMDLEQWDEAKAALDSALLAAERGRHHQIRGDVQLGLVYYAMQRGKPDEALAELTRAEAVVAGMGNADANLAKIEDYRATALAQLNKLDDARAAALRSIAYYEKGEGKDTISLANPLTQLAYVEYERHDLPSAVKLLERAMAIQARVLGSDHPRIGIAHTNLAFNLSASDRLDEAQQHAEAARANLKAALGAGSPLYGEASRALVGILQRRGDLPKAEAIAREIVDSLRARKETESRDYANALEDLAASILAQMRHKEALPLHQEVLALREKILPPGHPALTSSQINVADILADLERYPEAIALYERAQQTADGPNVPPYLAIAARLGRGRCLVELRQFKAAIPVLREALARNPNPEVADDVHLRAGANFVLAQALAGTKQRDEARKAATSARDDAKALGDKTMTDRIEGWLAKL
ncbi:MAG TPA: serine/threonine-protein kinase [Kofleriaceae bacterium]